MKKWNLFFVFFCVCATPVLALNLGGLKLPGKASQGSSTTTTNMNTPSVDDNPYTKLPPYGMSAIALADQIDAYVKSKFKGEGGMYKTSLESVVAHMKIKYGPPTHTTGILAEWILHAEGDDCTKMRFSFDGHFTNTTRGVGVCKLID